MRFLGGSSRRAVLLLFAVSLAGCAGREVRHPAAAPGEAGARCAGLLAAVDRAVAAAGVADGANARLDGHPELRASRFLCALGALAREPGQQRQWLALLEETGRAARSREIANLPDDALRSLLAGGAGGGREAVQEQAASCSAALLAADQADAAVFAAAAGACSVPDDYSLALRTVGLYPLTAPVVAYLTHRDHERSRRWFTDPGTRLPRQGVTVRFAPAAEGALSRDEAREILAASRGNPLRVPRPAAAPLARLAQAYAPLLEQDVAGRQDRPGRVEWRDGRLAVDPDAPLAYFHPSWALRGDEPLLQLNYVFWYGQRTGPLAPWIERGAMDGVVARITLGGDGLPLLAEFMMPCGCYHGYVPVTGRVRGPRPRALEIDPFVPAWVEDDFLPGRLALAALSGWHRVEGARVSRVEAPGETVLYRLEDYAVLEALPAPGGTGASAFGPDGVMKGTDRWEANILFPMGIPAVGSLRQRGRHPIRLVGREHFDDPRRLERDFELP